MSPARKAARGSGRSMIWVVPVALALAGWAVWSLATTRASSDPASSPSRSSLASPQAIDRTADEAAPRDEIGEASREALRDILRQADEPDRGQPQ